MSRLVVVSNRVRPARGEALAGGVAIAITDVLEDRGGVWFGWSGKVGDGSEVGTQIEKCGNLLLARVDLDRLDYEGYYNGHSNQCLWPLCHFRLDLMSYDAAHEAAYRRVNAAMAGELRRSLRNDDLVWVHDYHLIPFASCLRSLGCRQRMGFFLHVPFPPADLLVTMPGHQDLVNNLLSYDLIGLQTEGDQRRLADYLRQEAGLSVSDGVVEGRGTFSRLGCFPVGIDTARFRGMALSAKAGREAQDMRAALRGRDQIISVDRLDYSKGLLRRVAAFEALLASRPDLHGRIELLQIAPVSRGDLQDYKDFRRDLELSAARVNGRYARADWTPIRYLNRTLARSRLAALYRASRIGLVTPMRDGMNLVCKEYVAAQDPSDPGVLVLSCFAGAAQALKSAILVNPYDVAGVASGIEQAQRMSLEERQGRHEELMSVISSQDSTRWAESFIDALGRTRSDGR